MSSKEILKVITIDGPAASGKSTTAREIARRLGWCYIDTGAMYRALGLAALNAGKNPEHGDKVKSIVENATIELTSGDPIKIFLNGVDVSDSIRTPEASEAASQISVHSYVRKKLVELQRNMGLIEPSVLEGRDTGTVVFPDAGLKIFLSAGIEERVRRRVADYRSKEIEFDHAVVREELKRRDERDSSRDNSPLKVADDAIEIDTTSLTIPGQVKEVLRIARERFGIESNS